MAKGRRKQTEEGISKSILERLKPYGFNLVDKELNLFQKQVDNVMWEFSFYLTGTNDWSLFCNVGITYLDLTKIMHDLIEGTEASDYFEFGVGDIRNEGKIVDAKSSLKISSIEEVETFSDSFCERIKEIENKYWIPQSDPKEQMEGFKKMHGHWVNSILSQNIALWISHGIKTNNIEEIRYGLERGEAMQQKTSHSYDTDKLLLKILNEKLKQYIEA